MLAFCFKVRAWQRKLEDSWACLLLYETGGGALSLATISRPQLETIRVHILRPAGLDWRFCKILAQNGLPAYRELLWDMCREGEKEAAFVVPVLVWAR